MPIGGPGGTERESVHLLLLSSRDWFASALRAVLEPEGFSFAHVGSGDLAAEAARREDPDIVIVDEGLPDRTVTEMCGELLAGPLADSVPILVYSPNFWHETEQARAMAAGAWDIIREPIRSRLLVAKLRRLLQIKQLIEASEEGALTHAGLFSLTRLLETLPVLAAVAERSDAPLSCAVLGPTEPRTGEALRRQREDTARLCTIHTRLTDVCAWVGEADLALVAVNANLKAATEIVRRLSETRAGPVEPEERNGEGLSAGIVALSPAELAETRRAELTESRRSSATSVGGRTPGLASLAAARSALGRAREGGGGIRLVQDG